MNAISEVKPATHASIATALAAAQMEMGKALKSANNPHFKSKYADLSSVTDACLPALNRHGIAVIQPMGEDETGRYVETVLIHGETGEKLSCRVPLIVQKNDMQGYGSACTYARRYGLMAMAGIAPEDDDGHAAAQAAPHSRGGALGAPADNAAQFERAVTDAIASINREKTMIGLGEYYADLYRKTVGVASDPRVVAAKDARKIDLTPKANTDLGGDEIPYEGPNT